MSAGSVLIGVAIGAGAVLLAPLIPVIWFLIRGGDG